MKGSRRRPSTPLPGDGRRVPRRITAHRHPPSTHRPPPLPRLRVPAPGGSHTCGQQQQHPCEWQRRGGRRLPCHRRVGPALSQEGLGGCFPAGSKVRRCRASILRRGRGGEREAQPPRRPRHGCPDPPATRLLWGRVPVHSATPRGFSLHRRDLGAAAGDEQVGRLPGLKTLSTGSEGVEPTRCSGKAAEPSAPLHSVYRGVAVGLPRGLESGIPQRLYCRASRRSPYLCHLHGFWLLCFHVQCFGDAVTPDF
ncbi:uncharacterized protein LOC120324420 [Pipra filicauda]|uniref:Uncharacterized protein LOC120324420 n=1 Tax=Pipra filicauda TaxID=649802 RepID=A0A7R5L0X2_9PASS|nr:uncharacterized protein LOC120324420 [Pipra filicauda]